MKLFRTVSAQSGHQEIDLGSVRPAALDPLYGGRGGREARLQIQNAYKSDYLSQQRTKF